MYILGFLSILGWVFLLYRWRSKYAAYYPLLTATTVICSLYIGAYLKILSFTSALIFGVGLLLLLKALLQNLKTIVSYRLITRSLKIIPISIVFFVLVGLAWYIFTLKATIFGWDEFFWGQFTKAV